jgi:multiple sugar transport system ATP-binding protein
LSNLDAKLRVQMRGEITALQRRLRTTTIFVTHDQVEAMTMGDRLAVINRGQLQQVGTPKSVYHRPANLFVATFIGSPAMNLFASTLETDATGRVAVRFGARRLPLPDRFASVIAKEEARGRRVVCGLRPEAFCLPDRVEATRRIAAQIEAVEMMGHEQLVHFRTEVEPLSIEGVAGLASPASPGRSADETGVGRRGQFVARLPPGARVQSGEQTHLGVDLGRLYLFDGEGRAWEGGATGD